MYRNTGGTQRTRARARLQHSIAHKSSKFIGVKVHIGNLLSVMATGKSTNIDTFQQNLMRTVIDIIIA